MSKNNTDITAKFISGILSQPVLNDECAQGFASRNQNDKDFLANIIRSQRIENKQTTNLSVEKVSKKEGTSKVDKIIADFLDKVKQRGIQTTKSTIVTKDKVMDSQESYLYNSKRIKIDNGPLKYFENTTPSSSENTRTNIFIPEIDENRYFSDNNHFEENNNPRQTFLLKNQRFIDLDSKEYSKPSIEKEYYQNEMILSQRRKVSPELQKPIRVHNNGPVVSKNIPLTTSKKWTKQPFNFPCNGISPIEYCNPESLSSFNKYHRTLNFPNAFSTPLSTAFKSQRDDLFEFERDPLFRSMGTQTECNHKCMMCTSPPHKKTCRKNIDYLFEE